MPIDFSTFSEINISAKKYGNIEIVPEYRDGLLVPIKYSIYEDNNLWMEYDNLGFYSIKQLYSFYDIANGDVLLSGLGFGIIPVWLLNKKEVKSITVVEKNKNIIDLFKESNNIENINIINDDIRNYKTTKKYNFVGLDHYELESQEYIIEDSINILKNIQHDSFWIWSLEKIYLKMSYDFSEINKNPYKNLSDFDYFFTFYKEDIVSEWKNFVNKNFPNNYFIKNIDVDKVKEYIYTFYSRNNLIDKYKDINKE